MAVEVMAEHDDAEQASGQCARACGALTRVHRACLWRARRACATPLPQGGAKAESSAHGHRDVAVCLTSVTVGNLGSWVRLPWLAHDEAPGRYIPILQYRFNKTKQHTPFFLTRP